MFVSRTNQVRGEEWKVLLQKIADKILISELLSGYCRMLDTMALNEVDAYFTEDCVVEFGPDARLNACGSADLAEKLSRLWRWRRTAHHLSNVEVQLLGDNRASAMSYVLAWHQRDDGTTAILYGLYRDALIGTAKGWRIYHRRQEMNGSEPAFPIGIFPAERRPPPPGWTVPEHLKA
ncbi:nuclear transport factor 2 family protein [Microvirga pudoricolor]|uniref:nuclear transport factor 2 family protein n=1 Tax=Microvirga pudoricolor TaxID=2778729 RepID=UPI0019523DBF|nr:nuclear transport factor 2 family protein [Microvirga pudoricolor]MBM6596696.1 nuclear transport factor 2 family protein [Microvirga pudoricolor]